MDSTTNCTFMLMVGMAMGIVRCGLKVEYGGMRANGRLTPNFSWQPKCLAFMDL